MGVNINDLRGCQDVQRFIRDLGRLKLGDTIRGTFDALRPAPPWHGKRLPKLDPSLKASREASTAIAESLQVSISELA